MGEDMDEACCNFCHIAAQTKLRGQIRGDRWPFNIGQMQLITLHIKYQEQKFYEFLREVGQNIDLCTISIKANVIMWTVHLLSSPFVTYYEWGFDATMHLSSMHILLDYQECRLDVKQCPCQHRLLAKRESSATNERTPSSTVVASSIMTTQGSVCNWRSK